MARLLDCPTEILLDVFGHLRNIDHVIQLALACSRLYRVFDNNRIEIVKRVILHSDVHKYDVALCHFNDTFQAFSSTQLNHPRDWNDIDMAACPSYLRFDECLNATDLTDNQVLDVLARWHGLKPLRHLYINCAVHASYINRPCHTGGQHYRIPCANLQPVNVLELYRTSHNSPRTECDRCTKLQLSDAEAARFYTALTKYWLNIMCERSSWVYHYGRLSAKNDVYKRIADVWFNHGAQSKEEEHVAIDRARQQLESLGRQDGGDGSGRYSASANADGNTSLLQESLEVLEVYDFVYGYLMQNTSITHGYYSWRHDHGDEDLETLEDDWTTFVFRARLALTPPDILQLLALTARWISDPTSKWSTERKTQYLRERGAFCTRGLHGSVSVQDEKRNNRWYCYDVAHLERACLSQLWARRRGQVDPADVALGWDQYRAWRWPNTARGNFRNLLADALAQPAAGDPGLGRVVRQRVPIPSF
ncbi:uncharacterized protein K452DRAFT_297606 [Aplosporella prunicola CBS 121167]|uniref:F-box domain-containing protein n=1 Tax=Aplosporella prunicola CBS 121167 TaxID=1176127 RepID=A0A6A6BI95_9PEZI|nr:uncharacterized protein K452DRAFT_297606 [Aplosporella prunicola CBS 121167]KAF2142281.1 hypothetical protein K452DRAFT_297606 [Aplosporella prunicola CBS 121167]